MRNLTEQDRTSLANSPVAARGVAVAVAVILESSDGKVLMTQRAQHMRSFPRAWVPPGGHLGDIISDGSCISFEDAVYLLYITYPLSNRK